MGRVGSLVRVGAAEHRDPAGRPLFSQQIEHYRLDWHRFNLKQRLLGRRTLPMEVFEEKTTAGKEWRCPPAGPGARQWPLWGCSAQGRSFRLAVLVHSSAVLSSGGFRGPSTAPEPC